MNAKEVLDKMGGSLSKIEDTYAEAFEGFYCRTILTAEDKKTLKAAAEDATATPATVIGRTEGGIEKWLSEDETPDNRPGAVLQFWGETNDSMKETLQNFEKELSYQIRQDILVKPFTSLFNATADQQGELDMINRVGHCGDGYEWIENRYNREMIIVPTMVPDFEIEHYIGYSKGVAGGNFWYFCETKETVLKAGRKALEAIQNVEGAITPFDIVSAGSKPETNFPEIGPTTNHPYCPSLKEELEDESMVPDGVEHIPEIVINARSLEECREALRRGIEAVREFDGVREVSAGNYGGDLGDYKIYLHELFE